MIVRIAYCRTDVNGCSYSLFLAGVVDRWYFIADPGVLEQISHGLFRSEGTRQFLVPDHFFFALQQMVAEMTGRTERMVRAPDGNVYLEKRDANNTAAVDEQVHVNTTHAARVYLHAVAKSSSPWLRHYFCIRCSAEPLPSQRSR